MKTLGKFTLLLLLPLFLMACGAAKTVTSGSLSSSSTEGSFRGTIPGSAGGGAIFHTAKCSPFNNPGLNLSGYARSEQVCTDIFNCYTDPNHIPVRLENVPSQLLNADDFYINFWAWDEVTLGQKEYYATYFSVRLRGNAALSLPGDLVITEANETRLTQTLSKSMIDNIISKNGLSTFGINRSNFLDHVLLRLSNMGAVDSNNQYILKGLTLAVYDQTNSNALVGSLDLLIPEYISDPNAYLESKGASSLLPALHPLYAQRGSNIDFDTEMDNLNATSCLQ